MDELNRVFLQLFRTQRLSWVTAMGFDYWTKPYGVIPQHIGVSWCISTYRVCIYIYIYTHCKYYIYIIYIYVHIILKLFTMANLQIGRHSAFCPNAKAKGRSSTCCIPQGRRHCSGHPIFTQTLYKERKMYADSKPFDIWYIYIYLRAGGGRRKVV